MRRLLIAGAVGIVGLLAMVAAAPVVIALLTALLVTSLTCPPNATTADALTSVAGGTVTVVTGSGINASEAAIRDRLTGDGYTVTVVDDDGLDTATPPDLWVVSKTVESTTIGSRLHDTSAAVMTWEDNAQSPDFFGYTSTGDAGGTAWHAPAQTLTATDGPLAFYTSPQEATYAPGPVGAAQVLARHPNGQPTVYRFDAGDMLGDGTPAAGRRVFFGLYDDTFRHLTPAGLALFDQQVAWASGGPHPQVADASTGSMDVPGTILAVARAEGASDRATLSAFMVGLVESGNRPGLTEAESDLDSAGWGQHRRHWLPPEVAEALDAPRAPPPSQYVDARDDWVHPDDPRHDLVWSVRTYLRGENGMLGALAWDRQLPASATAGYLAAAVQRPAAEFRGRYDDVTAEAQALLDTAQGQTGAGPTLAQGDQGADPNISNVLGPVRPHVEDAARAVRAWGYTGPVGGTAHRPNEASDHPSGLALDFGPGDGRFPRPSVKTELDALNAWLIDNADALGLAYTIWHGTYYAPSNGWQGEPFTSSVYNVDEPTGGHYDHIHASFTDTPGTGTLVSGGSPAAVPAACLPGVGVAAGAGPGAAIGTTLVGEDELARWRALAAQGGSGPPGTWQDDWERITTRAVTFRAENAPVLVQPHPGRCVRPGDDQLYAQRHKPSAGVRDAAFYALVTEDPTVAGRAAEHLLAQFTRGYDYADTSTWCREHNDGGGHSPWFTYAQAAERYARAYGYLVAGDYSTPALDAAATRWLWHAADHNAFHVADEADSITEHLRDGTAFDKHPRGWGGWEARAAGNCNNRILDNTTAAAVAGVMSGHADAAATASRMARLCISVAYDPDGQWWADVHRGEPTDHKEAHYGGSVLGEVIKAADALARTGDPSVITYTADDGRSLRGWMRMWAGIATGHLDGPPGLNTHRDMRTVAPTYIYMWPAHHYYGDPLVGEALGLPLPDTAAVESNGAATVWEGSSGSLPGLAFLFGGGDGPGEPITSTATLTSATGPAAWSFDLDRFAAGTNLTREVVEATGIDAPHGVRMPERGRVVADPFEPSGRHVLEVAHEVQTRSDRLQNGSFGFVGRLRDPQPGPVTLAYDVAWGPGFLFHYPGGKMVGLAVSRDGRPPQSCAPTDPVHSSWRLMWRQPGHTDNEQTTIRRPLVLYGYHEGKTATCGDNYSLASSPTALQTSRWYSVAQEVTPNTPGRADGRVRVWVDGRLGIDLAGVVVSSTGQPVDLVNFATYFGGDDPAWGHPRPERTYYRGMQVAYGTAA